LLPALVYSATNAQGQTIAITTPLPTAGPILGGDGAPNGGLVSTIDQFGNSVVLSGVTNGAVITTTDAVGQTLTTTWHAPAGGAVRSEVLVTTVLPNGQRSIVTSYAFVIPTGIEVATQAQLATQTITAAGTSSATAGLQTGAAAPSRHFGKELAALIGGAVGVAWLL